MKKINVEVEGSELLIQSKEGHYAVIPAKHRQEVMDMVKGGCDDCINSYIQTLPVASQYAQDGSVYPPNKKVKVNHDNQIKEYDISSPEYRDLYNSGKLMSYDKNSDTYIATPLEEVTITAEAPQWLKDKRNLEKQYTKDWYIDNNLPKFSRSMGISSDNMGKNQKGYDEYINNKVAESILKRNPKVGSSNNERLAWYNSLSEKERDIVNNSYSADKFSPAVRAYMESQSNEAKKYGILETFRDIDKLAQSVEGTPERFRIFPNAENNYENYVNPLMWIGDMAKGLGNVPKDIKEENYLKAAGSVASPLLGGALGGLGAKTTGQFIKNTFLPLGGLEENIVKGGKNLVSAGLVGKLSKVDKVIDATKAGSKVSSASKNASLEEVIKDRIFLTNEEEGLKNIPWNTKTNKSVQDEFIEEQIEYMNSPAFVEKMKANYPDVDIEQYKKAILHNLQEKITGASKSFPNANLDSQVAGWYTSKDNIPSGTFIMPGYEPSFKRRVELANESILRPSYNMSEDAGKSYTKNVGTTVEHELGHQRTNSNWLLPDYLTKEYLTENLTREGNILAQQDANSPFGFFNYHSNPTEFDTRLLNMKRDLKRQNIIDFTKSNDFTPEHIKQLDVSNTKPLNIADEIKSLDISLKKGEITKEQYDKLKNFYEKSKNLVTTTADLTVSSDTKDLLKYWSAEFLAEQMKKLPAIIPPAAVIGTATQSQNQNKSEQ